jgi:hypothetical protein
MEMESNNEKWKQNSENDHNGDKGQHGCQGFKSFFVLIYILYLYFFQRVMERCPKGQRKCHVEKEKQMGSKEVSSQGC